MSRNVRVYERARLPPDNAGERTEARGYERGGLAGFAAVDLRSDIITIIIQLFSSPSTSLSLPVHGV